MTQKIKNYAKALLISSLSIVTLSCSKDKSAPKSDTQTIVNAQSQTDNTKLTKFLSISMGVDASEVKFNQEKNSFEVRTHSFPKDELAKRYEDANEYKAKYEN